MSSARSARLLTPLRAWLLALLLLAAQAAGLSHRLQHASAPGPGSATAQQAFAGDAHVATAGAERTAGDHAPGSADCRLIDQLSHADALCAGMAPATVQALAHSAPRAPATWQAPRGPAAHYLARAPPQA